MSTPFAAGAELPAHQPNCFGCGPANGAGLHLHCRVTEAGVAGRFRLERWHEGGPGIAHGGVVSAVLDDLFGFLLYRTGSPMVTARLEVDFRRPLPLGVEIEGTAEITSAEGRKIWTAGRLCGLDGTVFAEGRALFVRVPADHFERASAAARRAVDDWRREREEGGAGPGPVGP